MQGINDNYLFWYRLSFIAVTVLMLLALVSTGYQRFLRTRNGSYHFEMFKDCVLYGVPNK